MTADGEYLTNSRLREEERARFIENWNDFSVSIPLLLRSPRVRVRLILHDDNSFVYFSNEACIDNIYARRGKSSLLVKQSLRLSNSIYIYYLERKRRSRKGTAIGGHLSGFWIAKREDRRRGGGVEARDRTCTHTRARACVVAGGRLRLWQGRRAAPVRNYPEARSPFLEYLSKLLYTYVTLCTGRGNSTGLVKAMQTLKPSRILGIFLEAVGRALANGPFGPSKGAGAGGRRDGETR